MVFIELMNAVTKLSYATKPSRENRNPEKNGTKKESTKEKDVK
jgi:hypothetical protein